MHSIQFLGSFKDCVFLNLREERERVVYVSVCVTACVSVRKCVCVCECMSGLCLFSLVCSVGTVPLNCRG